MKPPIQFSVLAAMVLAAALPRCVAASVEKTNSTSDISPDAFKIISQKNIFNANRRPGVAVSQAAPRPPRAPSRFEAFSLIGTMLHDGGRFAFFDGSDSQYKKVLKAGDVIAGYKITDVTNDCVKLEGDGGPLELNMGMQMSRRDEGKWQILVGAATSATSSGGRDRTFGMNDRRGSPTPGFNGRDRNFDRRGGPPTDGGNRRGRRDRGSGIGGTGGTDNSGTNSTAAVEPDEEATAEPAAEPSTNSAADDILKRLMEKREKENK